MNEGAIIHHVLASSISLAPPQAAGLIHSAARSLPTRSCDLAGTPVLVSSEIALWICGANHRGKPLRQQADYPEGR